MNDKPSEQEHVNIVKLLLENGRLGKWGIVRPYISDDIVLDVPESLPFGGRYRGWDGYVGILQKIGALFYGFEPQAKEFFGAGNKVVVVTGFSARIVKNEARLDVPLVDVWEFRGGQVVGIVAFYQDTKKIADLFEA